MEREDGSKRNAEKFSKNPKSDHPIWSRSHLSKDDLKKILSCPDHQQFHQFTAELLEATMDIDVVQTYLDLDVLAREYDEISNYFSTSRNKGERENRLHWDRIVEVLRDDLGMGKTGSRSKQDESNTTGLAMARTIGARLRRLRTEKGYTQQEMADRLGCSRSAISQMEQGKRSVTLERVRRYTNALGYEANIDLRDQSREIMDRIKMEIDMALDELDKEKMLSENARSMAAYALTNLASDIVKRRRIRSEEALDSVYQTMEHIVSKFEIDIDQGVYEFFLGPELTQKAQEYQLQEKLIKTLMPKVIRRLTA
jgi:transcriptional regulator with XRE-family HTH domain